MDIRLVGGVAIIVFSVAATGAAGQLPGNSSEPLQEYEDRAQSYELFIQSLRLEDSGDVVHAIDLLSRASELDPGAAAIPAAQAALYAQIGQTTDAIRVAERALTLDAEYGEAHRVLGLIFATLSEQTHEQRDGRSSSEAEVYRGRALTHLEQAVVAGELDGRITFILARLYVETGAVDKAIVTLEPFVRDRPGFVDGLLLLVRAYVEGGRLAEAVETLEEAIGSRPRSVRMLNALAELYESIGRWREAADTYERVVSRRPSDTELKRRWAVSLLNAGDREGARDVIKKIVEVRPTDALTLYLLSEVERQLKNFDAAEAAAQRVIELEPSGTRGIYALVQVYLEQGQQVELVDAVESFVKRLRENGQAPHELAMLLLESGVTYQASGDDSAAVAAFELARDVAPSDPTPEVYLGQAYLESRRVHDAVKSLSVARERHVGNLQLDGMYAHALVLSGQTDQGIVVMETALLDHADEPVAHIGMANLLVETGRVQDAVETLIDAERRFPADSLIPFQLGVIFEQQAQHIDAELALRAALERDPSNHMALNYLGYMLADRGERLHESVQLIQRALESDPHNGAYLDSLGWAYFKLEKWDLAETHLRQASEQLRQNSVVQDHFGDLLFKRGRYTEAIETWERAIVGDAESIDLPTVERKIRDARERVER
ncbi:MAG: tetratricopeptide repeat protein [Vicinamibacterales bacterium]|jgi:tetratricopeptide (TPR) repeat protein|nr:hypothetical protein [Acidobacteriota bacterium]MDP7211798.1 tetratricopeptide repeat protein [Vicinamibacterales bacterium]HJO17523.1 tetratricopeptide repeat protein [Vicinamibacterales bacterium]|tara:strand:- start:13787 stop:15778 length:1992 start_codon:yes stop_codon:yes gene_type:complete